jgi:hypothetical protein
MTGAPGSNGKAPELSPSTAGGDLPADSSLPAESMGPSNSLDKELAEAKSLAHMVSSAPAAESPHLSSIILKKCTTMALGVICLMGSVLAQTVTTSLSRQEEAPQEIQNEKPPPTTENPPKESPPAVRQEQVYDTITGSRIAKNALLVAKRQNTYGYCYRGVKFSLRKAGIDLYGGSAHMAAQQLAGCGTMKEISVKPEELASLQPGSVVVWSTTKAGPDGHISIALGNGKEASDHVTSQITRHYGGTFRVFIPVKIITLEQESPLSPLTPLPVEVIPQHGSVFDATPLFEALAPMPGN